MKFVFNLFKGKIYKAEIASAIIQRKTNSNNYNLDTVNQFSHLGFIFEVGAPVRQMGLVERPLPQSCLVWDNS